MTNLCCQPLPSLPNFPRLAAEPLETCADEELLTRFRDGEEEAFDILVRRYQRPLARYLSRYLSDPMLADDVVQNTFLQVFLKGAQYESDRPVRPWLYTIATNQAIDALRRNSRHRALSLEQTRDRESDDKATSPLELLEARDADPVARVTDEETRQNIRASIDRLSNVHRQVLLLAYYQGLKYREVAAALGIPVGTVKSRLHDALSQLRRIWRRSPDRYCLGKEDSHVGRLSRAVRTARESRPT